MAFGESQSGLGRPGLPRLPAEGNRYYLGLIVSMGLRNRLKETQSLLLMGGKEKAQGLNRDEAHRPNEGERDRDQWRPEHEEGKG